MALLDGQVAVVTGSSRGLGRAIAQTLAREGAAVVVNYLHGEAAANQTAESIRSAGGKCVVVQADVSKPDDARNLIRRTIDEYGRLDVLVNNAGITRDRTLRKMSDEDWNTVIENNLDSVFYCTSAAVPQMIEQRYGRIINIASFVGQAGNFGQANYSASKAGIIGFTKTAAIELARYNITVNALAPGFITSDMTDKIPEDLQQQLKGRIPLGRFGEPDEIAEGVLYLAAHGAYITGHALNINGGVYM